MDSANDLDMAVRDAIGRDAPAGISSRFICQAMLKVEELDQRRVITEEARSSH